MLTYSIRCKKFGCASSSLLSLGADFGTTIDADSLPFGNTTIRNLIHLYHGFKSRCGGFCDLTVVSCLPQTRRYFLQAAIQLSGLYLILADRADSSPYLCRAPSSPA